MSFRGVFSGYEAAHAAVGDAGNLFDQPVWTDSVHSAAAARRERIGDPDLECEWYERDFLGLLAAELHRRGRISVLDFGGGPGTTFVSVVGKIRTGELTYHVADLAANCRIGEELLEGDPRVEFLLVDPDAEAFAPARAYDIVLSSSTVQYARNWRHLLGGFAACAPSYIVLPRLLVGRAPTFTTIQTVTMSYGPHQGTVAGQIPCTFLNQAELCQALASLGYTCIADVFGSCYRDQLAELPVEYRDATLRTMVFGRGES